MFNAERFWRSVAVGAPDACWLWKGGRLHFGHGAVDVNGKQDRAHRIAWILTVGPIPAGLCVLNRCDNPPCCNPLHLFLGTKADNVLDRDRKGRTARGERHALHAHPEKAAVGERNGRAKITAAMIPMIHQLRREGQTLRLIAERFGLGTSQVHRIIKGESWQRLKPSPR